MSLFGAKNDPEYERLLAENAFINDLQLEIENALRERDFTQVDLARLMGVSEARVSQILGGNGRNLQARTIARIAHAVGMAIDLKFCDGTGEWANLSRCDVSEVDDFASWTAVFSADVVPSFEQANDDSWHTPSDRKSGRVSAA
ncbi:helix-turn-helix transcriptional regulator [Caulobacter segnis]|uniref:HTH cro/C1-type domain-containing protein n=1 Tax=Caulobacter segnis TaxID=88688 RepID=A0A2W5X6X2_9CAUL|nr:helix-turn-helix transcriptional regulator [Caulobacter segnis]PZR32591.1 MAG: hypothetical protein DI526_16070 [Caulobacter segnis]